MKRKRAERLSTTKPNPAPRARPLPITLKQIDYRVSLLLVLLPYYAYAQWRARKERAANE